MRITLVTRGRLWRTKQELIIREQYTGINAVIDETLEISLAMKEVEEVSGVVDDSKLSAKVEVVESVGGEITDPTDVSGNIKEC